MLSFLHFFQKIISNWIDISQHNPNTASLIFSESLWYNSKITIDNKSLSPAFLGLNNIVFVKELFDDNGAFLAWEDFALKFNLNHNHLFKWIQLKNSIPKQWVKIIKDSDASNLYYLKPHINFKERMVCIKKMTSAEFYKLLCEKI